LTNFTRSSKPKCFSPASAGSYTAPELVKQKI
jgi:hypothetical protein